VEIKDGSALIPLIQQQRYQLEWGTTLIVITGRVGDELLNELYQARRGGQNVLLILTGTDAADQASLQRAKTFSIPVTSIVNERDLNIWMQTLKHV
jgi:hypothetical protein